MHNFHQKTSVSELTRGPDRALLRSLLLVLLPLLVTGCNGSPDSIENTPEATTLIETTVENNGDTLADNNANNNADNNNTENVVDVGTVRTIQVADVVLSSLPENIDMPPTASVELGRLLFWDPVLSGNRDIACASCHLPEFGYSDGRQRSAGVGGVGAGPNRVPGQFGEVTRNAPTVLNTVWNGINEFGIFDSNNAPMFWDARALSLEAQAIEPIHSPEEMRGGNFTEEEIDIEIVNRLNSNSEYQALFQQAYNTDAVSTENIAQALADFQRTLIANKSPFDRYLRGDTTAMTNAQLNGMEEFVENECSNCHSGPMFSDFETHVLGVAEADGLNQPDDGDGNFAFRTPSLRQLAFTAPYFHGGQEGNLNDAIDFYDNTDSDNPNVANNQLDPDFRNLPNLNNNEIAAIEDFLESLNDSNFDRTRPTSVPSGLPVGGLIN